MIYKHLLIETSLDRCIRIDKNIENDLKLFERVGHDKTIDIINSIYDSLVKGADGKLIVGGLDEVFCQRIREMLEEEREIRLAKIRGLNLPLDEVISEVNRIVENGYDNEYKADMKSLFLNISRYLNELKNNKR